MSDDEASWMKETVMNEESSWTREKEKPSSSSKKSSVKFSSKTVEEIQSREKNKRLRAIFEDENLDYGKDATTKEELEEKFKKALSIREKQIGQVLRLIGQARFVQLCFLIDATGSMQPHIDGVKDSIKKIVNVLLEQRYNQEAIVKKMQLAMVAYRDYNDKKQFEELQFTDSVEDFKTFCQRIEANGGGDACEDVLGGLDHALKLKWDPNIGTKVIFHMADYPGHGRELHDQDSSYDDYLNGDPIGLKHTELFQRLRQQAIEYHFGKITDKTNIMIEKFSSAYGEKILEFDVKNVDKIFDSVLMAVEFSVASTVSKSTMVALNKTVREHEMDPNEPDWSKCPEYKGRFLSFSLPDSIEDIVNDVPLTRREPKSATVKIAENPFGKGTERLAYYGLDVTSYVQHWLSTKGKNNDAKVVKNKNEEIVLKEYLHVGNGMNSAKRYELNNQIQTIASFMATKFSEELKLKADIDKTIKFLKIRTLAVANEKGPRFMSCERRFKKEDIFVRFTNNTNYIILQAKAEKIGISVEFVEILMAFSHWTYQASNGNFMIVDLQGIVTTDENDKKQIILTDPAIHSVDITRYGPMNHGADGMKNFFQRHTCNGFCDALGLEMPKNLEPRSGPSTPVSRVVGNPDSLSRLPQVPPPVPYRVGRSQVSGSGPSRASGL